MPFFVAHKKVKKKEKLLSDDDTAQFTAMRMVNVNVITPAGHLKICTFLL
jgi:hypothetical protein